MFAKKGVGFGCPSGKNRKNEKNNYLLEMSIYNLMITEVACGSTSLGNKYFTALDRAETYKVKNNKLTIFYEDNSKLNFIKKKHPIFHIKTFDNISYV